MTGIRPGITPPPGPAHHGGSTIYLQWEFQDIFIFGLKIKSLKKKRQKRRNCVNKVFEKCYQDLDNIVKEENMKVTALLDGIPL